MRSAPRRPEPTWTAAFCITLAGCGQSVRSNAGADAREPNPSDPCVERPPITEPAVNCAYPVAPMANPPTLESIATLARPNCSYRLGAPVSLPWDLSAYGGHWGAYQFSFDVNGDAIGDIFFWDEEYGSIRLAVSSVQEGLAYHVVDCDSLGQIPRGRVFVADINGDGAPDLVVGESDYWGLPAQAGRPDAGVSAFVNLPSGFVEVMHHRWPETSGGKTTLLDVAVADFDGNGACLDDIAFGYNRWFDGSLEMELGATMLLAEATWPAFEYVERGWADQWSLGFELGLLYNGNIASGMRGDLPPLVVLQTAFSDAERQDSVPSFLVRWQDGAFAERAIDLMTPGAFDAWITPLAGRSEVLVALRERDLVVYDLADPAAAAPPVLFTHPVLGMHGAGGLLAGGDKDIATRFLLDLDGDGDGDFVEWVTQGPPGQATMAIHPSTDGTSFGDPVVLEVVSPTMQAPSPFVAVGEAEGALIVNELVLETSLPPSVQALECAPE